MGVNVVPRVLSTTVTESNITIRLLYHSFLGRGLGTSVREGVVQEGVKNTRKKCAMLRPMYESTEKALLLLFTKLASRMPM